jgi:hypothetical protein
VYHIVANDPQVVFVVIVTDGSEAQADEGSNVPDVGAVTAARTCTDADVEDGLEQFVFTHLAT